MSENRVRVHAGKPLAGKENVKVGRGGVLGRIGKIGKIAFAAAIAILTANVASAQIQNGTADRFALGYANGAYAEIAISPGFGAATGGNTTWNERFKPQYLASNASDGYAIGFGWFRSNGQAGVWDSTSSSANWNNGGLGYTIAHYMGGDKNISNTNRYWRNTGGTTGIGNGNENTPQNPYITRPGIAWESVPQTGNSQTFGTGSTSATISFGENDTVGTAVNIAGQTQTAARDGSPNKLGQYIAQVRQGRDNGTSVNDAGAALRTQGQTDATASIKFFVVDLTGITSDQVQINTLAIGNTPTISAHNTNEAAITLQNSQTIDTTDLVYGQKNIFKLDSALSVTSLGFVGDILLASTDAASLWSQDWSMYFVTEMQADAAQVERFAGLKEGVNTANGNITAAKGLVDTFNANAAAFAQDLADGAYSTYEEALAAWLALDEEQKEAAAAAADADALLSAAEAALAAYQQYGSDRYDIDLAAIFGNDFLVDASLTAGTWDGDRGVYDLVTLDADDWSDGSTPEPATLLIFGLGMAGVCLAKARRTNSRKK